MRASKARAGDVHEVAPRAGLAARQMHLQHAKLRRFAEDAQPGRGIELVRSCIERERVRAIRAAERATMGQLGEEPERLMQHCGIQRGRRAPDPKALSWLLSQLHEPFVGHAPQKSAEISSRGAA